MLMQAFGALMKHGLRRKIKEVEAKKEDKKARKRREERKAEGETLHWILVV